MIRTREASLGILTVNLSKLHTLWLTFVYFAVFLRGRGREKVIHYWESQHRSNTWFRDSEVGLSIKIEAIRHDFYVWILYPYSSLLNILHINYLT